MLQLSASADPEAARLGKVKGSHFKPCMQLSAIFSLVSLVVCVRCRFWCGGSGIWSKGSQLQVSSLYGFQSTKFRPTVGSSGVLI